MNSHDKNVVYTPEELAKNQLDCYNRQDLDAFVTWFADDVEVYVFPNTFVYKGVDQLRERYKKTFEMNPNQHAALVNRTGVFNTVMDNEHVTGTYNGIDVDVIAIYRVANNKIQQVYFVRD